MKVELIIQKDGQEVIASNLEKAFKEMWKESGKKVKDIKNVQLFFNADEMKCYYAVNEGSETGEL